MCGKTFQIRGKSAIVLDCEVIAGRTAVSAVASRRIRTCAKERAILFIAAYSKLDFSDSLLAAEGSGPPS